MCFQIFFSNYIIFWCQSLPWLGQASSSIYEIWLCLRFEGLNCSLRLDEYLLPLVLIELVVWYLIMEEVWFHAAVIVSEVVLTENTYCYQIWLSLIFPCHELNILSPLLVYHSSHSYHSELFKVIDAIVVTLPISYHSELLKLTNVVKLQILG